MANKWFEFSTIEPKYSVVPKDFEMITISIKKLNFSKMTITRVYKPHKGNVETCIKFLKEQIIFFRGQNYEVWILGDLNVDLLRRADANTVLMLRFVKV